MITLNEAVAILKEYRSDLVPDAYWLNEDGYVLRTKFTGEINSGYYAVDEKGVIGTNPIRSRLDPKKMHLL